MKKVIFIVVFLSIWLIPEKTGREYSPLTFSLSEEEFKESDTSSVSYGDRFPIRLESDSIKFY